MGSRVVFLRSKSPAGVEPRLTKEASTLAASGYEVHAILWDRERAHAARETRDGIRIQRYRLSAPEGRSELAWLLPRWWLYVLRSVLWLRPRIVHAIDFDTAIPALLAARILGAAFVYEIYDFYADMVTAAMPRSLRRRFARWERAVVARADLVILPDRRREAQLDGVRPRRLVEIMNVPEDRTITATPPDQFVLFYGGMIAGDRGLKDLVIACEETAARFLVAGHGPDEAELLPVIETSPACMYLGTIPYEEVLRHTAESHAIAALYDPRVPNNRFASPNKLFEAMMLRKPVIVSDETAAGDVVREAGCGIVVPYGDRDRLRAAIERLMLCPAECEAMGARGRAAFESRYNWRTMASRLVDAYAGL